MRDMTRRIFAFVCGLVLVFGLVGCAKPSKSTIVNTISTASREGTTYGLKKWAEKDPVAAQEAADAFIQNADTVILPYLKGEGSLHTSAEVQALVNSSLFVKIPDEVKLAVTAAATVLDLYMPVPDANKLDQDHLDYLIAFVQGVRDGAVNFDKRALPKKDSFTKGDPKKNVWIK